MSTPENTILANAPKHSDFADTVNLLNDLGEANRALRMLETIVETGYAEIVGKVRPEYATLQAKVTQLEAALEVIARRNESWFFEKKSVKTPFGIVKFTASKEITAAKEDVSIQLIIAAKKAEKYLRTVQVLNIEALEKATDLELAGFGLVRKAKENFSVTTEIIDLGKAVKSAEKTEKAAAKAARGARETANAAA